ncbi:protein NEOXANTHIN-DEFICIENT 1 isoform X2 [Rutidosis leptorrhynchoides]|uniref:protein NEOXANTHIN-DEFICIENT 1 isoform X2 n=1 Tax=Rutidosis leptorrhynchoides TaxID=125765 RepID=UPI003A98E0AA
MEVEETKCSSGYGKPPWIFKGSALYQFHLVKSEIAKAIIPKEFRLVEAFGYTLGGFFLAKYNESPFGTFDELVVIAGIVWNPPTSHAWAARVYVNSDEACRHGRKEFGLPSQLAMFSKSIKTKKLKKGGNGFLTSNDVDTYVKTDTHVTEIAGPRTTNLYDIRLTSRALKMNPLQWMSMGPLIHMSLPSFSGHTEHTPHLLKYSCQMECRVKPTSPAKIIAVPDQKHTFECDNAESKESAEKREMSIAVMLSKPILALKFNCLMMEVEPPVVFSKGSC